MCGDECGGDSDKLCSRGEMRVLKYKKKVTKMFELDGENGISRYCKKGIPGLWSINRRRKMQQ
jgi:hypothetical protein